MGSIEKSEAAAEKESKGDEKKTKQDPAKEPNADNKTSAAPPGEKASKADEKKEKEEVKPASRKRQKEIFGRLPPPQSDVNFYNMTVVTKKKKSKGKSEGNPSKSTSEGGGKPSQTKMDEQSPKAAHNEINAK